MERWRVRMLLRAGLPLLVVAGVGAVSAFDEYRTETAEHGNILHPIWGRIDVVSGLLGKLLLGGGAVLALRWRRHRQRSARALLLCWLLVIGLQLVPALMPWTWR